MIHSTRVSYFDGLTSTPQTAELTLDDVSKTLRFTASSGEAVYMDIFDIRYEAYGENMRVKFKNIDAQIAVEDKEFAEELKRIIDEKSGSGIYQKLMGLRFGTHVLMLVAVIAALVALYIYATPFVADKAVRLIPVSFDVQLGDAAIVNIVANRRVDSAKTEFLNELASRITWDNNVDLKFYVINSPIKNAFALPNGNIAIFSGLLEKIDDHETLLALLAHEAVHVNKRHSVQMMCRSLVGSALLSILTANAGGLTSLLIENAGELGSLSYSRKMEFEADAEAIALLEKNSIDPDGMVRLMEILRDITKNDPLDNLDFLSSHPAAERRIERVKSKITKRARAYNKDTETERIFEEMMSR